MDRDRHHANNPGRYQLYFDLLYGKIDKYNIEAKNTYNMDEKGFLVGVLKRSKRVFNRPLFEGKTVRQTIQDGNREFITMIACICADGTAIAPAVLYASESETIQSTWVEEIGADCEAFVGSTTSGWSNNDMGVAWLTQVFDRYTKAKAGRSYRLLIVDGHRSHLTKDFIDYCHDNKILLAIYPPHATHRLQPLDVCVFKSLSAAYSAELDEFIYQSQALLSIVKRDFLRLFWTSWTSTMTHQLITKAFQCTGIWPQDPAPVLQRFDQNQSDNRRDNRSPESSTTSALSASDTTKLFALIKSTVSDLTSDLSKKLCNTIQDIAVQKQLLEQENQGLRESLIIQKKRQNKGKKLPINEPDGSYRGATFWSPHQVQRSRDILAQQEAEKQQIETQKNEQIEARRSAQIARQKLLEERRIAREGEG